MLKIAHIINPVMINKDSDLYFAQPVTFETMKRGKKFVQWEMEIEQYAVVYPEDVSLIPPGFIKTDLLTRSVLDFNNFTVKKKLPLIRDIINEPVELSDADYFVYTNVDIALMPHFYLGIKGIIKKDYDAFLVNRRTIPGNFHTLSDLPLMYAELGAIHPGHDCFVIHRELIKKFVLGQICVGAKGFARGFMANMIAFAKKYQVFEKLNLTFHLGDRRVWQDDSFDQYYFHNLFELIKIFKQLLKNNHVINRNGLIDFYLFNINCARHNASKYKDQSHLNYINKMDTKFRTENLLDKDEQGRVNNTE